MITGSLCRGGNTWFVFAIIFRHEREMAVLLLGQGTERGGAGKGRGGVGRWEGKGGEGQGQKGEGMHKTMHGQGASHFNDI